MNKTFTRRQLLGTVAVTGGVAVGIPVTATTGQSTWPYTNHDSANTNHAPNATGPRGTVETESLVSAESDLADGVVVADGTLYLGRGDTIGAYTLDGAEQWTWTAADPQAGGPVAYAGQLLFVNTGGGDPVLRFIETEARDQRVRATSEGNVTMVPAGDSVYVSGAEGVVSLDREGDGQWQRPLDQPAIGVAVGEQDVFVTTEEEVVAVRRDSGDVNWRKAVQAQREPVVADGRVYVGGETLVAFDSADGTERWRSTDLPSVTTVPAATAETVYVGAGDGGGEDTFFAVDAGSGEIRWRAPLGGTAVPTTNPATTRPAVTAEMVYVGSERTMHGLDAETGEIAWRTTVDGTVGPPVPVDGQLLFTTTEDEVIVVDESQSNGGTGEQSEDPDNDGAPNQEESSDSNDGGTQSESENSDDGSGPGFGVSTGLTALGGVGYLLRRRLRSGREESSRELSEEMDQREEQDDTDE